MFCDQVPGLEKNQREVLYRLAAGGLKDLDEAGENVLHYAVKYWHCQSKSEVLVGS